jgi:hypothetical protein
MINLAVEMSFVNPGGTATPEAFEAFLDEVMDQLDALGVSDADVTASLVEKTAEFSVSIEAESFEDAVAFFMVKIRTALHAANCSTAGWPTFQAQDRVVRELDSV